MKADLQRASSSSTTVVVATHPSMLGRSRLLKKVDGTTAWYLAIRGNMDTRNMASHTIHGSTGACSCTRKAWDRGRPGIERTPVELHHGGKAIWVLLAMLEWACTTKPP